jgi:ClpP class serine protease
MIQALLDDVYSQFVGAVAEGRGLERSEVLAFAEGRIYSGQQALALKMVDEMGGFEDAVEAAGKLANITGRPKLVYPRKRFSFKDFLENRLGLPGAGPLLPALSGIRTPLYLMQ